MINSEKPMKQTEQAVQPDSRINEVLARGLPL